MEGLKRVIFRITPIIMLFCFVCLGISYAFNIPDLTYLTYKYTQTGTKIYYFDLSSYINNIDIDILKKATSTLFDVKIFENIKNAFTTIWADGYQAKDILKTVGNGFIMLADTIIYAINFLLIAIRIICGILLTGMSLIGININAEGSIIINGLNTILENAIISYIQPIVI